MSNAPAQVARTVRLDSICRIVQGGRHKLSGKHFIEDGGYPAYGAGGHNGNLPSYEFDEPAIVLSAIGARCGKCFQPSGRWSSLANTSVFFPDAKLADLRFLWYQLNDESSWHRSGTAQPYIKPSDVKARKVYLPPLVEQKRIAGILDAADALRAKRREALAQLDTLLQSIFLDMFGDPVTNPMEWEVSRLADVAEFHAGSSLPSGEDFVGQDGGYLNLKVSDLNAPENTTRIVSSKLWSTDRGNGTIAPERATVFPKRGGAIGTNKKRLLDRAAILDPNLMAVSAGERLHHLFLYRWFFTFDLVDITSGSTVPQLNKRDLSPLPIRIPPIHLQHRFAAIVESVECQKASQRAHFAELDTLFASLQTRAFQGDL